MKTLLPTLLALLAPSAGADHTLTWCGIDYGLAAFSDPGEFTAIDDLVPHYLPKWNQMWLAEVSEKVSRGIGTTLVLDTGAVDALNGLVDQDQIVDTVGPSEIQASHIDPAAIEARVRGYALRGDKGTGLVVIVDILSKINAQGCSTIVFFDLGSRAIRAQQRVCEPAQGFGVRNYWFSVVRDNKDEMILLGRKMKKDGFF